MPNCETKYCRKQALKGRKICGACKTRRYRENNPMMSSYMNLRANAKRRGKPFAISFEYFSGLCYETNYIAGKGRTRTSYSLDCIVNELGYVEGNIRVIPVWENSKKGTKVLQYDYQTKYATVTTVGQRSEEWFDE